MFNSSRIGWLVTWVTCAVGAVGLCGCTTTPTDNKGDPAVTDDRTIAGDASFDFTSANFDCPVFNENTWAFVNPLGDASSIAQAGGVLSIVVDPANTHGAFTDSYDVPRVVQDVGDGDFALIARFDSTFTSADDVEQNQGFIVEESATRFLRFDASSFDGMALLYAAIINVGGAVEDQELALGAFALDEPIHLRLVRTGTSWEAAFSADGANWTVLTTLDGALAPTRAGVYAGNTAGTAFTAHIDYIIDASLPGADCNSNGNLDVWDLATNGASDCNGDGAIDDCAAAIDDCNTNGVDDADDLVGGTSLDCNSNGQPDECELTGNDCNTNGTLDECEFTGADADGDEVLDDCDNCPGVANMNQADADGDGVGDACETLDCNSNGLADDAEIADGTSADCNSNAVPDACEMAGNDCDGNDVLDGCELAGSDGDGDGVLDACDNCPDDANPNQADSDSNGVGDACEEGTEPDDCNNNGIDDADEIAAGSAADCNDNGVPDACELAANDTDGDGVLNACDNCPLDANADQSDADTNGIGDACEDDEVENDCNNNSRDDATDIACDFSQDCNDNGVPDECDIDDEDSLDCNTNGVPDECDLATGTSLDCNDSDIPDECELVGNDDDGDCILNVCDNCPDDGNADQQDSDDDGVGDACDDEIVDCNDNDVDDATDIACESSADCDADGVPDECQDDGDGDGLIDACDDCPDSDLAETISYAGCDSRVPNVQFDNGCTMKDELAGCVEFLPDIGDFAHCVADLLEAWEDAGLISFNDLGFLEHCLNEGDEDR